MKFSPKHYAEALYDILSTRSPKDQEQILNNFVEVLARNNDLRMHEAIAEEFHRIELKQKGVTLANVTTAHSLNAETEKELIKDLNKLINGKVELKKKIDDKVIGGVVVQMEDTLIDASVKRSLADLKNNLEK